MSYDPQSLDTNRILAPDQDKPGCELGFSVRSGWEVSAAYTVLPGT